MKSLGPCLWCQEDVLDTDDRAKVDYGCMVDGKLTVEKRWLHSDCQIRSVVGSVGHLVGLCGCNGGPGTMDDPPFLTRREAASVAARTFILSEREGGGAARRAEEPADHSRQN